MIWKGNHTSGRKGLAVLMLQTCLQFSTSSKSRGQLDHKVQFKVPKSLLWRDMSDREETAGSYSGSRRLKYTAQYGGMWTQKPNKHPVCGCRTRVMTSSNSPRWFSWRKCPFTPRCIHLHSHNFLASALFNKDLTKTSMFKDITFIHAKIYLCSLQGSLTRNNGMKLSRVKCKLSIRRHFLRGRWIRASCFPREVLKAPFFE